ncbi:hypothetical protein LtaPh_0410200 [Leishmania tarentolae]|uniref:Uncharacterized protein n=1 Tax=Leishmania tarentolae TaxID=5689 RepID=A0A640K8I3_LEITA|nr:hypothetical protein LtaPh_0410200 [Leishmania tarentolae]
MSDASASPPPSVTPSTEFTLRDYVVHQRVLQQLLQSQPVWLLDDVLGLQYRARLRLRLSPHPELHFTEDAADGTHCWETDRCSSKGHDAVENGRSDFKALLIDDEYPVVPLTPACGIDLLAEVGEPCGSHVGLRIFPAAACGAAVPAASVSFFIIPASMKASLIPASAWATVLRRLCRPSVLPLCTNDVVGGTKQLKSDAYVLAVPCHVDPLLTSQHDSVTPPATHEGDGGLLPIATPTPSSCSGYASSLAPAEASPAPSPARLIADAMIRRDVEERRQVERLTEALLARTREVKELKERLRQVTTTPFSMSAAARSTTVPTPTADAAGEEVDRPPTIAHASNGLVPALERFSAHLTEISSEDDDDSGGCGDEEGSSGARSAARAERNGFRGDASDAVFVLSDDSARPQAPRSGHVYNLGSLGPMCGDEDALRIYNEIHGGHSSSGSTGNRSSASHMSSATSVSMQQPAA